MKAPAITCQGYSLEVGSSFRALDSRKPSNNIRGKELIAGAFIYSIGDITHVCQIKNLGCDGLWILSDRHQGRREWKETDE
jgi:hypothetical protein